MKPLFCSIFACLLLFVSGCSRPAVPFGPTASAPAPSPVTAELLASPVSSYTVGTIIPSLDTEYIPIRAAKSPDAEILCAAASGVRFMITEQTVGWYGILLNDSTGFVQSQYLKMEPSPGILPAHKSFVSVPRHEEIGLVQTKYNNMLSVREDNGQLAIYTESGTLLADNAVLEIREGEITFDPAPSASAPASPTPSAGTAAKEIKIVIKNGKVVTGEGIPFEKNPLFEIGKDTGKVITVDKTIIEQNDVFPKNAVVKIAYGKIYSNKGSIELEPDYYLVPAMLKDELEDVTKYSADIAVDLMLAKDQNMLGYQAYCEEVCLLQKGTIAKLLQAQAKFKADGYSIVIYDAYRPYSVTVKLYEKYKDGTYVAPLRFGSNHNKGAAVDMSLLDRNGIPIEMPSAIHTLDSSSNRNNKEMSKKARENMEYMASVMRSCGFEPLESEWWHFTDREWTQYLRTDHDFDKLLRVIYE